MITNLALVSDRPGETIVPDVHPAPKITVWRMADGRYFESAAELRIALTEVAISDFVNANNIVDSAKVAAMIAPHLQTIAKRVDAAIGAL